MIDSSTKKKYATIEDLIVHAFELDYKQVIRLRHPATRRPSDSSSIRSTANEESKPPPQQPKPLRESNEVEKKVVRVSDAAQIAAADRLSRGYRYKFSEVVSPK